MSVLTVGLNKREDQNNQSARRPKKTHTANQGGVALCLSLSLYWPASCRSIESLDRADDECFGPSSSWKFGGAQQLPRVPTFLSSPVPSLISLGPIRLLRGCSQPSSSSGPPGGGESQLGAAPALWPYKVLGYVNSTTVEMPR